MARVDVKLPDDFLEKLSRLGEHTDTVAEKVLEAGSKVVLDKVRSNLVSVVGSNTKYPSRSTGQLVEALGVSPMKLDRNGNHNVKIGFSEPRSGGGSNAQLANILEYGKSGQPPKPFLKPAKSACRGECVRVMKEILEQEVEKL